MSDFDLMNLAVNAVFPTNKVIMDDAGMPSIMVYVPKFKMSDVITGATDSTHPAFIVDGVEKDGIWYSKYPNITQNNLAYSLPGEDPRAGITADAARTCCESKGPGWHLMSAMEWGAIALWCKKNGYLPYGNNNYGKDSRESNYVAIPTTKDAEGKTLHTATGTGPVTWSHNKQLDGIYDLSGNVAKWVDGMRLVKGELQILENNNSANHANSKAVDSAQWKAIDGTTGNLITPNGQGTTPNSLKLDYISNKWKWITGAITVQEDEYKSCAFVNITAESTVCAKAKELLYALALLPDDADFDYEGDVFYANNGNDERFPHRGGYYNNGTSAGVFCMNLYDGRGYSYANIGFCSAFYE